LGSGYTLNSSWGTDGVNISGDTATFEVNAVAVPEPGTFAAMLVGLGMLLLVLRGKRFRTPVLM